MRKVFLLLAIITGMTASIFAQSSDLQKWANKTDTNIISSKVCESKKKKDVHITTKEEVQKEIDKLYHQREYINKMIKEKEKLLKSLSNDDQKEMAFADSLLNAEKERREECIWIFLNKNKIIPFYNVNQTQFFFKEKNEFLSHSVIVPKLSKCQIDTIIYDNRGGVNTGYSYPISIIFKSEKGKKFEYKDELNYQTNTLLSIRNGEFINKSLEEEYPNIRFKEYIKKGLV